MLTISKCDGMAPLFLGPGLPESAEMLAQTTGFLAVAAKKMKVPVWW